jgi:DhnA family fructose-bisphosphate aldolase class Ia
MLRELLESGARGVFFGRKVFQAPDVLKFLRTVRSVLNGKRMDARVDEALSVTTR